LTGSGTIGPGRLGCNFIPRTMLLSKNYARRPRERGNAAGAPPAASAGNFRGRGC
jgi:hypothetical protein